MDTSPFSDFKGKEDGFLVLRYGDENGLFDKKLVDDIKDFLDSEDVSYVFKPSHLGMTELGRIIENTNGKINGCTIQLPSLNYHTAFETSTIQSLENYTKVILKLCKKF